ncbi:MAG: hypothetical protein V4555_03170 [Acidobacteriota bacterium]
MEAAKQRSRTTRGLLAGSIMAVCFFTYNTLSLQLKTDTHIDVLLHGGGLAPEQYRIGVIVAAAWITRLTGLAMYRSLSVLLCASLIFASFCLLHLLEQRTFFRRASAAMQWFGSAVFVLLFLYYLQWLNFYGRPETLPSMAILAAMLWLWSLPADRVRSTRSKVLITGTLVLLASLLGFIRADLAISVNAGVWIACLMRRSEGLSLGRGWALGASALSALSAGTIQLYLMRVVYQHTTYGTVRTFMLTFNLTEPREWLAFAVFLLPLAWMVVQIRRLRFTCAGPDLAFLSGAGLFGVLWMSMGKIDEVRIFLPFASALIPLTVEVALRTVTDPVEQAG